MTTDTEKMCPQQQPKIETRAPRHRDDQDLLVREPKVPRKEGDPAPCQQSKASTSRREESLDPSPPSTVQTKETPKAQVKPPGPPGPPPRRVAILVMGGTGVGKSSFIAEVTGQQVRVGHNSHSCTAECTSYECRLDDQNTVALIDTPGFNDTKRLDLDILKCITTYLMDLQRKDIPLAGIIFMQRITDRRMTGASFLNLKMFQAFCGEKFFPQVVLVTTMWNTIRNNDAAQQEMISRERELATTPEFWGNMIHDGATVKQFHGDRSSGLDIIHLLYHQGHTRRPHITEQLAQGYMLPDTGAGQVMMAEIIRQEERMEREEREEREEMEAERLIRQREQAAIGPLPRSQTWSQTHAGPRGRGQPPRLPARSRHTERADQRQPHPTAVRAAQVVHYSSWTFRPS